MSNLFSDLVASRQAWIAEVLKPWCRAATWKELMQAHQDWTNLAGTVDPHGTLWAWAWSRCPILVSDDLPGIDETHRVRVVTRDGRVREGYPDNRESRLGKLRLLCEVAAASGEHELSEPISIDDVMSVELIT